MSEEDIKTIKGKKKANPDAGLNRMLYQLMRTNPTYNSLLKKHADADTEKIISQVNVVVFKLI